MAQIEGSFYWRRSVSYSKCISVFRDQWSLNAGKIVCCLIIFNIARFQDDKLVKKKIIFFSKLTEFKKIRQPTFTISVVMCCSSVCHKIGTYIWANQCVCERSGWNSQKNKTAHCGWYWGGISRTIPTYLNLKTTKRERIYMHWWRWPHSASSSWWRCNESRSPGEFPAWPGNATDVERGRRGGSLSCNGRCVVRYSATSVQSHWTEERGRNVPSCQSHC